MPIVPTDDAMFEVLATQLSGSRLHSLLLAVMERRAAARAPKDVAAQYARDRFCAPSGVDLRALHAVDGALLDAAEGFEAVDLSPLAPLGVCSSVAPTHQNRVVSALRGTEVVSDPTNVLAVECAGRLRGSSEVHLTTCQRVVRAQPVPDVPGYTQHFRIFVLSSAGVERKDHGFTVEAMIRHVATMQRGLDALERVGFAFGARRVEVLCVPERRGVAERIAQAVGGRVGDLVHTYYSGGLRYQLWVTGPDGEGVPLIDGGAFDWVAKLAANRRAVYVATGAGAELIAGRFRSPK